MCVSVEEKQLKDVANKMTGLVPASIGSRVFKPVALLLQQTIAITIADLLG